MSLTEKKNCFYVRLKTFQSTLVCTSDQHHFVHGDTSVAPDVRRACAREARLPQRRAPLRVARVTRTATRRCWTMYPAAPDLPYVLSEREEINSILYKPINSTQRIKVRRRQHRLARRARVSARQGGFEVNSNGGASVHSAPVKNVTRPVPTLPTSEGQ